jgi:acetyltransferase
MFSHSSAEDLRLRCLGAIKDFPRAAAARLAHCDPGREVAFAAIDLEAPTGAEIVGLVHLIDFPDQPGAAEFDIMVRSDVQSHGIGLRLMTQILAAARDRGLLRVVGYVAGENGAMLTLAGELGFRFERLPAGVVRVTTDL